MTTPSSHPDVYTPSPSEIDQLLALFYSGRYIELESKARELIGQHPNFGYAWKMMGVALRRQGKAAISAMQRAAELMPYDAEAHNNLGNALQEFEQHDGAVASYRRALEIKPDYAEAHSGLGNALQKLGQINEAVASYRRALEIKPDYAEVHCNLGYVLQSIGQLDEAVTSYRRALEIKPDYAEAHNNLGSALQKLGQVNNAAASYCRALEIKPDYAEAHCNLGSALEALGQLDDAVASCRRAVEIKPDYAEAHNNLGNALQTLGQHDNARVSYLRALELKPDCEFVLGMYLHCKMHSCNWDGIADLYCQLLGGVDAGKAVSPPFPLLAIPSTPAQQKQCSEIFIHKKHPEIRIPKGTHDKFSHDKIRLGYFSSDFHNHATSYLMAELFELHDRSRFELYGFSYGAPYDDHFRQRISAAIDHFIDVRNQSDQDIATLAKSLEIDIAIDLKGFTGNSRAGIFALRPAQIQVSYLGYPGTMGAPYIDYLIADPILIPVEQRQHYTEKIAYLPNSYQINDSHRLISEREFTRSDAGLPDEGFIFCCFNNNYKVTPPVFDIWMQLLKRVEGSALWLLEGNAHAVQNLQNEAIKHGIAPDRIVFARRLDLPEHLARHRLADLFLDTFYCNAHTTASDALWAGLPVLTCLGETFASRVAASLLNAMGLPELVAHSHEEYLALALELATTPEKLASIKQKLGENRTTHPLFNASLFTQHIEEAFIQMSKRHQLSLPPDYIYV